MKVLILGGYGVFGGRLVELIADCERLELLICGRSLEKAERYCASFKGDAKLVPLQLDRLSINSALTVHRPDLVVDASGPFQDYGDRQYRVVEACIDARINYLDFADAADFVFGVSQFDTRVGTCWPKATMAHSSPPWRSKRSFGNVLQACIRLWEHVRQPTRWR